MSLILSGTDGLSDVDGTAATPAIRGTDANTGIFFPAADTIAFAEGGAEAMRIDSSGFVGIGTTTPSSFGGGLVVRKSNTAQGVTNATAQFSDAVNSALWVGHTSGATNLVADAALTFGYSNGTTTTENARITTGGNVGIGTSSPADNLHVVANTSSENGIRVQNLNASGQSAVQYYNNSGTQKADLWWNNNGSTLNLRTLSTDPLIFYTNNSERMRIDSTGNLLVGRTTQTSSEKVCFEYSSSVGPGLSINNSVSGNGTAIQFITAGSGVGNITTGTSNTAYNTASDYRLKNTIAPMTGALAKVALLKPVTYKWNIDSSSSQGFIAHELQEVVPDCVNGEKDAVETYTDEDGNEQTRPKYQGIDTSFLVATLTAAIQEQQALITALTARITALETAP